MDVEIVIIENDYAEYKNEIISLISELNTEKKYFNLTLDRTFNSTMLVLAIENGNILGLAGNEQKFKIEHYLRIVRGFTMVNRHSQGKGIGPMVDRAIFRANIDKKFNLTLAVIDEKNERARHLAPKFHYEFIGIADNLAYYGLILSKTGFLIHKFLVIIFPLIRLLKKIKG